MELEQQNKPRRRGRPPKNKMENLIIPNSEIVHDDMDLIEGDVQEVEQDVVSTTPLESVVEYTQPETVMQQSEVIVENTTPNIIENNSQVIEPEVESGCTQILNIPRFSKIIGKDEEYITQYLENTSDNPKLFLNKILDLLEQSCIKSHKYTVGDYVWIPEQVVDRTTGGYGKIEVVYLRKPRRVKINKVIYTTKICYGFEGFTKLQVLEQYCFNSKEECQKVCDDLNVNI